MATTNTETAAAVGARTRCVSGLCRYVFFCFSSRARDATRLEPEVCPFLYNSINNNNNLPTGTRPRMRQCQYPVSVYTQPAYTDPYPTLVLTINFFLGLLCWSLQVSMEVFVD